MLQFRNTARDKHVSAGIPTRVACFAGKHSSKELFEQIILFLIGTTTVSRYILNNPLYVQCI